MRKDFFWYGQKYENNKICEGKGGGVMKRFKAQQVYLAFIMLILSIFLITGCGGHGGETDKWLGGEGTGGTGGLGPASCDGPGPVDMGAAANFGVLAGPPLTGALTCTLPFTVNGDVAASTQSCTLTQGAGFHNYTGTDPEYVAASADMLTAIACAQARPCSAGPDFNFTSAHNFGGATLQPGVYCVDGAMSVDSNLTFTNPGVYIFLSSGALTTSSTVTVAFGGSANATNTSVFWVPGGAAHILGTNVFLGTIMPGNDAAITLDANTTLIPGRVLSNSAVTLGGGGLSEITIP
ncbi:MAG: ice-binding family protein [Smithellaceae bacterium]